MRRRQGFLLVSVLLITLILLTLGLSFLGKRAIQYRRIGMYELSAQAEALAESGIEDALTKLRRDVQFPPLSKDQTAFSYSERVSAGGSRLGSYTVTLDGSRRFAPYSVWVITSVGEAGRNPNAPSAKRSLRLDFDVSQHRRDDTTNYAPDAAPTNPSYYEVINFQDLGGL